MSDSPQSQNKTRPFDASDILLGAKVLSAELALGGRIDTFSVVKKIFDASGVISSRAMRNPDNNSKKRKENADGTFPCEVSRASDGNPESREDLGAS
jgi:hypothetical protein